MLYLNPETMDNASRTQRLTTGQDDWGGSDNGVGAATRECEESLIGSKMMEIVGELRGTGVGVHGHPCAAVCGHYAVLLSCA